MVEKFEYTACSKAPPPAWNGWIEAEEDGPTEETVGLDRPGGAAASATFEERLAEATRRSFESGRERGREEGRAAERDTQTSSGLVEAEGRRRQIADMLEKFSRDRDNFFGAVEQEVVRLALAVSARILRREAQMDPLLLTGAVRVALGQLAATADIRLRVPAKEANLWKETITLLPNLANKPMIVAEESMLLGDCAIESKVGTVDLGIRAQLGEIERGFFDRTARLDATARKHAAGAPQEELSMGAPA